MAELTSKFNRQDIETLIKAIGDWEILGDHEYRFLQAVKNAPLPQEDSEAFEFWSQVKQEFQRRERQIVVDREQRQEEAVFLKAKLMLVRREMTVDQLFEMATEAVPQVNSVAAPTSVPAPASDLMQRLEMAEYFIRDLGVWDHFQKFLVEKKASEA